MTWCETWGQAPKWKHHSVPRLAFVHMFLRSYIRHSVFLLYTEQVQLFSVANTFCGSKSNKIQMNRIDLTDNYFCHCPVGNFSPATEDNVAPQSCTIRASRNCWRSRNSTHTSSRPAYYWGRGLVRNRWHGHFSMRKEGKQKKHGKKVMFFSLPCH